MLADKLAHLRSVLAELPGAIVAYSGGVDSAFLAEIAHRTLGRGSVAIIADSPSLPRRELHEAVDLARSRGWRLEVVETDELHDERYAANPTNRCYFCKSALFDRLGAKSRESGHPILLGTNSDDVSDWRPGGQAAVERGVLQPMLDVGLSKTDVREASRRVGLATAEKPAAACLASRFAYGVRVTAEGLGRVEAAEEELFSRGFEVVRVRDLGTNRARIEVGSEQVAELMSNAAPIQRKLKALGFTEVELDPQGYRRGALNDGVKVSIGAPSQRTRSADDNRPSV